MTRRKHEDTAVEGTGVIAHLLKRYETDTKVTGRMKKFGVWKEGFQRRSIFIVNHGVWFPDVDTTITNELIKASPLCYVTFLSEVQSSFGTVWAV